MEYRTGINEDGKDYIDIGLTSPFEEARQNLTRYIYEATDKLILENMPQDALEKLYSQLGAEIQRRILNEK
jgi:hypothetical protein